MAALNTEREYAFEQRDLEVMQTAAGQVSVAVENARLFAEEQRRSRQLAFLNNISKTAISSDDSEQMLADIVGHIQKNFSFDHIGIGILDYSTKEIEIKAEAGVTAQSWASASRWERAFSAGWRAAERPRWSRPRAKRNCRACWRDRARCLHSHCLWGKLPRRAQRGKPQGGCFAPADG
jgi:GAF domain-containing protein